MKVRTIIREKKTLIMKLESLTGTKYVYTGPPKFQYLIGPYTVLQDGALEFPDDLLPLLQENGIAEKEETPTAIRIPTEITGRTITNLLNLIQAKGRLIEKAVGKENLFWIDPVFMQRLKTENPQDYPSFLEVLSEFGDDAMTGIKATSKEILFPTFPDTMPCRILAGFMVKAAAKQKFARAKEPPADSSEKYIFRVWLNSLGMKGEVYKETRAELLQNFHGTGSYKTEEQQRAFIQSRRKIRRREPEFVVL